MSRDIKVACRASTQNENGIPRKSPGYFSLLDRSSRPGYFGPGANMGSEAGHAGVDRAGSATHAAPRSTSRRPARRSIRWQEVGQMAGESERDPDAMLKMASSA